MDIKEKLNNEDRFAKSIGAQLTEVTEGFARAELTVENRHLNGAGVCQGGVFYTLADLAFAAVANGRGTLTLGISNNITFIQSAQLGERLIAECREVVDHHRLPYCEIQIRKADGTVLAVMTGLGYRLNKPI
ncbi:MAG: PaaI family thioesterase [Prevotella sp.]